MMSSTLLSSDRSRVLGVVAYLALVAAPRWADARPSSDHRARVLFERGQRAYNRGQFTDALKKYLEAYELKPLPGFLFNVAQCHRHLAQYERAAFFYKRYLALSPNPPKNVELVKKLIAEVELKLAQTRQREESEKEEVARNARQESPLRRNEASRLADASPDPQETPASGRGRPKLEPDGATVAGRAPSEDAIASLSEPAPAVKESGDSIFKKWWLWTGVGVVATGATAYVIASPHPRATTLSQINGR
jgi:tetratricopeptide (TPR) repeat protein